MTCEAGFVLHILIFLDLCHKLYFSADILELVESVWGWGLAINIVCWMEEYLQKMVGKLGKP